MDDVWLICVLCVIMFDRVTLPGPCDTAVSGNLQEGNVGESAHFPWLGVLRVHLHEGNELKIALTGLVLVKDRYAIANADDVAKIPKMVFKVDSKAMFIPKTGDPWYSMVLDYMTHPEYEVYTYNTIALVELALDAGTNVPFKPICWPGNFFNTSNQLYALGYTDDNKLLEKTVYKLQYVKPSLCDEFYNRAQLSDQKMTPTHIQCGYAVNNKLDCLWENGMALASNSTGAWTLVGLSVRGPSCSAPARFIDLFSYLSWIESATDLTEDMDYPVYRRSAFGEGFRKQKAVLVKNRKQNIPLRTVDNRNYWSYGFDIDSKKLIAIDRIDVDELQIRMFDEEYEEKPGDCSEHRDLVYHDETRVVDKSSIGGNVTYKVSLYDMHYSGYHCVKVKINSDRRSQAHLWYRLTMDAEDAFVGMGQTPADLLKHQIPGRREPADKEGETNKTRPGHELLEERIKDSLGGRLTPGIITDIGDREVPNLNILLWFVYGKETILDVKVYGTKYPQRPREKLSKKPKKKKKKKKKKDKENKDKEPKHRRLYQGDHPDSTSTASAESIQDVYELQHMYYEEDAESITTTDRPLPSVFRLHHTHKKPTSRKLISVRKKKLRNPMFEAQVLKNTYRLQKAMLREAERPRRK